MKHLLIALSFFYSLVFSSFGQNKTDNIALFVYLPQDTEVPEVALQVLHNQLENLAAADGNAGFVLCDRFVLTAKIDVLNKDIVTGPPQKISQTLSITLQIGDAHEHKLFASTALTAIGIGANLTKSYIEAFKTLSKNNRQIQEFLEKGKDKVLAYYMSQCESICQKAEQLANRQQYDEAIYQLACVPNIETDCYVQCQKKMVDIWQVKINVEGRQLLKMAQTVWAKSQNENGAEEAVNYLQQINPAANCQDEIITLINAITDKIRQDEEVARQFQLRQYKDQIQQEREAARNAYELEKMEIKAARDVAITYAKNQPKKEYYIIY